MCYMSQVGGRWWGEEECEETIEDGTDQSREPRMVRRWELSIGAARSTFLLSFIPLLTNVHSSLVWCTPTHTDMYLCIWLYMCISRMLIDTNSYASCDWMSPLTPHMDRRLFSQSSATTHDRIEQYSDPIVGGSLIKNNCGCVLPTDRHAKIKNVLFLYYKQYEMF